MSKVIGIFKNQEQAIDAVQGLERAGFQPEELKVLAYNQETSSRIESETDVHVDELNELIETREGASDERIVPSGAMAGAGVVGGFGIATYNGAGYPAGAAVFTDRDGSGGMDGALRALGLKDKEAEACRDAIKEGGIAVVAEPGDGTGNAEDAEAVFRTCGAGQII